MAKLTVVEALNQALRQAMARDDRVIVLGEDVGKNGGVFRVTQGLLDQFGENRVIDTPLSESAIIGASIGLAVYGLRPVPELQFEGFAFGGTPCFIAQKREYESAFNTPFSTQDSCWTGRPALLKELVSAFFSAGLLTIVTRSSKSFSPTRLPPPRLEKKDRPSSACLASKTPSMRLMSIPMAVGSRITSYLPGSSDVFPRQSRHFRSASAAMRSDSIVSQSAPSSPAQPDDEPSGVRSVSVEATAVLEA